LVKRAAICFARRRAARERLPAPNRQICILWIELHQSSVPRVRGFVSILGSKGGEKIESSKNAAGERTRSESSPPVSCFFRNAIKNNGTPRVVTLDAYAASHRAIAELKSVGTQPRRVRIRSCKYLNNVVEQDHRRINQRIRPMLGFKRFDTAAVTITGIELAQKIKKHQFKIGKLSGRPRTAPEIWAAVLAASALWKTAKRRRHPSKRVCTRTRRGISAMVAEWLDGFQRDVNPEPEVVWWERLAHCYVEYSQGQELDAREKQAAFRVIIKLALAALRFSRPSRP
jgi:hypothetical protein